MKLLKDTDEFITDIYKFTQKEMKIRKRWLIATAVLCLGVPILFLMIIRQIMHIDPEVAEIFSVNDNFKLWMTVINPVIWFWILYFTAYKKAGSICLTIVMFSVGLNCIKLLAQAMYEEFNPFFFADALLYFGSAVWWMIESLKLRKLNVGLSRRLGLPLRED